MKLHALGLSASVLFALNACSAPSPQSLTQNDPWESTNRKVFAFDVKVDHFVARPIARVYRRILPDFARQGLHNFLTNLHAPVVLANDALQCDPTKARKTLERIAINSTIGLAGFIDVASTMGIAYHSNDFGVTLGKAGVHEGSYLVLPFLGPLPPRDLLGTQIDAQFDPLLHARFANWKTWMTIRFATGVLDSEARRMDEVETIERTSIDFYATTRSLYRQSRNAKIHDDGSATSDLPEF